MMGDRAIEVETACHSPHTLAVEWKWENVEGVRLIGPSAGDPPKLVVTITQLDPCGP